MENVRVATPLLHTTQFTISLAAIHIFQLKITRTFLCFKVFLSCVYVWFFFCFNVSNAINSMSFTFRECNYPTVSSSWRYLLVSWWHLLFVWLHSFIFLSHSLCLSFAPPFVSLNDVCTTFLLMLLLTISRLNCVLQFVPFSRSSLLFVWVDGSVHFASPDLLSLSLSLTLARLHSFSPFFFLALFLFGLWIVYGIRWWCTPATWLWPNVRNDKAIY